jgi:hypothetical protein
VPAETCYFVVLRFRKGPITIEDVLEVKVPFEKFEKEDLSIREMSLRADPAYQASATIKRHIRPLDNPTKILEVLQATLIIKAGVTGNKHFHHWSKPICLLVVMPCR